MGDNPVLSPLLYAYGLTEHDCCWCPSGELDLHIPLKKADDDCDSASLATFHSFASLTFFSNLVYNSACLLFKWTAKLVVS